MADVAALAKEDELNSLFIEALLGAKTGDMGAAEDFADQLINIFQSSTAEQLAPPEEDDNILKLASSLGALEGLGIRGAL
mgnify:CR=1 FL=1